MMTTYNNGSTSRSLPLADSRQTDTMFEERPTTGTRPLAVIFVVLLATAMALAGAGSVNAKQCGTDQAIDGTQNAEQDISSKSDGNTQQQTAAVNGKLAGNGDES